MARLPGPVPAGPLPAGPVPAGPLSAGPVPVGPLPPGPLPPGPLPANPGPLPPPAAPGAAVAPPLGAAQAAVVAAAESVLAKARRAMASRKLPAEERLHRARVAIKRLRSYWRLALPHLPDEAALAEQQRLRVVAHSLAVYRDADVAGEIAARVLSGTRRPDDRAVLRRWARLRGGLAGPPGRRARALGAGLRMLLPVPGRLAAPAAQPGGWDWLEPGLRHAYVRARERWLLCRAGGSDETFHAWRRRIKDLQYFTELLRGTAAHRLGRRLKRLQRVADALGDAHDLAVLRDGLLQLAAEARAGRDGKHGHAPHAPLLRRLEHRIADRNRAALREARPLFALLPARWIADLRLAWERHNARLGGAPPGPPNDLQ